MYSSLALFKYDTTWSSFAYSEDYTIRIEDIIPSSCSSFIHFMDYTKMKVYFPEVTPSQWGECIFLANRIMGFPSE